MKQNAVNHQGDALIADLLYQSKSPTELPDNLYTEAWSYYLDREAWCRIPVYEEPKAVSGEIPWR